MAEQVKFKIEGCVRRGWLSGFSCVCLALNKTSLNQTCLNPP